MRVILAALATANPPRYATQQEVCEFMEAHFAMAPAERALYRELLLEGPIQGRHFAVDEDEEICTQDPDGLAGRFAKHSRRIAAQAARRALDQAGLKPAQVEGLIVNTCTGYLCPGLSTYLVEDLGLPAFASTLDLMGMGCGGALPNLETACQMILSGARQTVLCVSVEICSATFFLGPDPDLVVSNSIFSDGAAAAVLTANLNGELTGGTLKRSLGVDSSSESKPSSRTRRGSSDRAALTTPATNGLLHFLDFESVTLPRYREQLRYTTQGGKLRNVLMRSVPVIGAKAVAQVVSRLLSRRHMTRDDIDWWAVHPGGTQVLKAVERQIGLTPEMLRFSYETFRHYGNMSSPTVLFVLDKILREARPGRGDLGLVLSFGAGFTAFATLVEFC
jgi:predicted naringenin-chalcone synthase